MGFFSKAWERCKRIKKRRLVAVICAVAAWVLLIALVPVLISSAICRRAEERILTEEELTRLATEESFDCIVVLGCRVYDDGSVSNMLYDRVCVGVSLYEAGVSQYILMSGDHQGEYYNEVDPMREAAIAREVPEEAILVDPYGISTYDSIYRVISRFEGKRIAIVTHEYHLPRALYIADKLGADAYGVPADLRPYSPINQFFREAREILARCKDAYCALIKAEPLWGA